MYLLQLIAVLVSVVLRCSGDVQTGVKIDKLSLEDEPDDPAIVSVSSQHIPVASAGRDNNLEELFDSSIPSQGPASSVDGLVNRR